MVTGEGTTVYARDCSVSHLLTPLPIHGLPGTTRFIPNRDGIDLSTTFNLLSDTANRTTPAPLSTERTKSAKRKIHRGPESDAQKGKHSLTPHAPDVCSVSRARAQSRSLPSV